jgi:hypothetical protein
VIANIDIHVCVTREGKIKARVRYDGFEGAAVGYSPVAVLADVAMVVARVLDPFQQKVFESLRGRTKG